MRILHTADWHLGKRLYDYSRIDEQRLVLQEIIDIADREAVDAILIAGDLYDSFNPPNEAIELFYKSLYRLANHGKRAVIAIAGNHDSAERIEAVDPLAKECGIILLGYPNTCSAPFTLETGLALHKSDTGFLELKLPNNDYPLRILTTPYANEARLKAFLGTEKTESSLRSLLQQQWQTLADTYCNQQGVNVLMAHLFMMKEGAEKPEEPEDERHIMHIGGAQAIYTSNIPNQIQYTALGHLHRHHFVKGHPNQVAYSGSLLEYSFSEANQQKNVLIIDLEPNKEAIVRAVPLNKGKKLARKKFHSLEDAIEWLEQHQDVFVELTLVSDDFLQASEKRLLHQTHHGIMAIIPEVTNLGLHSKGQKNIDLSKNRETLFKEYFQHKTGQEAPTEIMALFKEITDNE